MDKSGRVDAKDENVMGALKLAWREHLEKNPDLDLMLDGDKSNIPLCVTIIERCNDALPSLYGRMEQLLIALD